MIIIIYCLVPRAHGRGQKCGYFRTLKSDIILPSTAIQVKRISDNARYASNEGIAHVLLKTNLVEYRGIQEFLSCLELFISRLHRYISLNLSLRVCNQLFFDPI